LKEREENTKVARRGGKRHEQLLELERGRII
jgi:hypothetical protein